MKHLLSLNEVSETEVEELLFLAADVKKDPHKYRKDLMGQTLLMIFEKPSLRTRLSFDIGMKQLGGFSVVIDTGSTPLGEKESIEDTAKVCGRYAQGIMARLFSHAKLESIAELSGVPVINGLTDDYHPVQILSDLLTIKEHKGKLKGLKLCYLGDALNNVTHSLLLGCALSGISISVGCPSSMKPKKEVVTDAQALGGKISITTDAAKAVKDADVVYTDSWMSYHISEKDKKKRIKELQPYQVSSSLMKKAKKNAIFMNCLPAQRGMEQTAEVIDGKQSVVFDQAENRLHMQKAILLTLMA